MSNLIVTVEEGKLQGCILQNYNNEDIVAFRGVPYAEPPLGELRFKAPKPIKSWNDVKDATQYGEPSYASIMSLEDLTREPGPWGSEDSLTLNIFTKELPNKETTKVKPVMLWVHGGGFTVGTARDYKPDFLLTEDIVLVTIQYRLGALGFLNFEDPEVGVPGNAGMKDMILALKWVQKNIKQFNGDADNVTIFGESAGGGAVHYLMLSPMAKGLFHKVISQSGCAINPWARGVQNNGLIMAKTLGCTSSDPKECLEFLQALPVDKILEGQQMIPPGAVAKQYFCPTVEKMSAEEAFLLDEADELMRLGNYNQVPLMTGFTSEESLAYQYFGLPPTLTPADVCIPWNYHLEKDSKEYQELVQTILKFYYGDREPTKDETFYSILSDIAFNQGIVRQAHLTANSSKEPVYFYRLSEAGTFDVYAKLREKLGLEKVDSIGVPHGTDVPFLFKYYEGDIKKGSTDEIMINRFLKMWTNFAKTGNPNSVNGEDDVLQGVYWKPLKAGGYTHLDIGKELSCNEEHPNIKRIKFWDGLDRKYKNQQ